MKGSLLNDTEYTEDEFNHFAELSGIDLGRSESARENATMFDAKPDDSMLDKESALYKQLNKYTSYIKDNISKIATYGVLGGGLVTAIGLLFRGGGSDDTDNNGSGGAGSAGSVPTIPAGSQTVTDDQARI